MYLMAWSLGTSALTAAKLGGIDYASVSATTLLAMNCNPLITRFCRKPKAAQLYGLDQIRILC
jgi:hypothetical protein